MDITLELIDSNGNVIATSFTEDPINDISDPNNKSGEPLSILLFEKPNSANYKLRVKGSTGEYTLRVIYIMLMVLLLKILSVRLCYLMVLIPMILFTQKKIAKLQQTLLMY